MMIKLTALTGTAPAALEHNRQKVKKIKRQVELYVGISMQSSCRLVAPSCLPLVGLLLLLALASCKRGNGHDGATQQRT